MSRNSKATRGDGRSLAPNQVTERIQASNVPEVWPSPSIIDRAEAYYASHDWPARALWTFAVLVAGLTLAAWLYPFKP